MKRWLSYGLIGACLALPALAQEIPSFVQAECPFEIAAPDVDGETVICGILFVPESRTGLSDEIIELQIAIIIGEPSGTPTVYLEGGPGGSAVAAASTFWVSSALRAYGDIILLDQRGTGWSWPSLNCFEVDEMASTEDSDTACANRLREEGIPLAAYTSAENAADVADLLVALNIDQANLFGVSYGTRLALTVMRDYPERIRSVIIDGVYPPHIQGYEEQPINGLRAFEQLFTDCAASTACASKYGDLRQLFLKTVNDLNNDPLIITNDDGSETEYYGDTMVDEIFQSLYDTTVIPYLPAQINALSQRNYDAYYYDLYPPTPEGIDVESPDIDDDSEGMFNALECYEEVPFNNLDRMDELSSSIPPELKTALVLGVEAQFVTCAAYGQPVAPDLENVPVTSDIPTLVMSGQYDPITPPSWGESAARYLSRSFVYTFPAMGHGVVDSLPCPTSIALQFLTDPTQAPNSDCLAQMTAPDFYVGD